MIIIVISDITQTNAQRLHSRQMARLQLIGQLARGVAHDLNTLFSGISGHASLLPRLRHGTPEMTASTESIIQAAEQGITLAGHLLELAHPGTLRSITDAVGEHVSTATSMLRDGLASGWKIEEQIEEQIPPVALSGIQIEQMVLNLGLLAADAVGAPGILRISVGRPSTKHLFNVGNGFAGVILITASIGDGSSPSVPLEESTPQESSRESGIIQSVIRSMIEEAGGVLYSLTGSDRSVIYRLALPRNVLTTREDVAGLPDETKAYLALWNILFARPSREYGTLDRRLNELGIRVTSVDNVISALARIEEDKNIDVMILDKYLLGQESKGLLKAILKIQPTAGIVGLCDDPSSESSGLSSDVVFVHGHADPNKILVSLVEAKNLALRRKPTRKPLGL
jgi:CheY-like chemotaxis protein